MRVQVEKIDSLQTSLSEYDHCAVIAKRDVILAEELQTMLFVRINLYSYVSSLRCFIFRRNNDGLGHDVVVISSPLS